ncbi:hypothetical protein KQL11_005050 [Salmonella enterica]|nr:hypothetical protein [Salmonella enterica]EIC4370362.1 hypothetical protein [Salmonella enterica]
MNKLFIAAACLSLLSGCALQGNKQVKSALNQPAGGSVVSVPMDNQCVKDFTVLKGLNSSAFSAYRGQFDEINRVYAMYQRDAASLGKDPKELLSMELGAKLNQVCSRVKYSVYTEVQKKLSPVSEL